MVNGELTQMVNLLRQLVELESPSHEIEAVNRVGEVTASYCRRLGGQVTVHPQEAAGNHIEARFSPIVSRDENQSQEANNKPGILLLCHMDTVFPLGTLARMPFHEQEGRLFGPGIADMKGGIVVALTAMERVLEDGSLGSPVTTLFTSDEEIGSSTSRGLIEKLARESCLVLVLEPGMPDGAVKTWRKGVGEFSVVVRGRAAHAGGNHEEGLNAIQEMAHQVLAIQEMTDYSKGTTLNVGTIKGGIASNVIPDEARIEVDLRVMEPGEADRIKAAMFSLQPVLPGTSITVSGGLNRPSMPYSDQIRNTFERIRTMADAIGIDLIASGTGGASDANFIAPLGIPVLDGLGPAGGEYHSEREYLVKNSLLVRTNLLTAILQQWEAQ